MAAVALGLLAADQVSKTWAVRSLDEPIDLFWTLRLRLAFNPGAAFTQFTSLGPVIAVVAVIVVVLLARLGRTVVSGTGSVALGMVLGGAAGNLLDRVFRSGGEGFLRGHVVDFIDLRWWPVFNIADIGIVVGGLLLVLVGLDGSRAPRRARAGERAEVDDGDGVVSGGPEAASVGPSGRDGADLT